MVSAGKSVMQLELHVKIDKVGLLIGKGGSTFRELTATGANVVVAKDALPGNDFKIVKVSGAPLHVQRCESMIRDRLSPRESQSSWQNKMPGGATGGGWMASSASTPVFRNEAPRYGSGALPNPGFLAQAPKEELPGGGLQAPMGGAARSYLIPNQKVGLAIGKMGATFRELQSIVGSINIENTSSGKHPNMRRVDAAGTLQQLAHLEWRLNEILEGALRPYESVCLLLSFGRLEAAPS